MKPEDGHQDDSDPLPQRRRDALGAQGVMGLCQQSDDGIAQLPQNNRSGAACVLIRCQKNPRG
jgi:hypothetical protein